MRYPIEKFTTWPIDYICHFHNFFEFGSKSNHRKRIYIASYCSLYLCTASCMRMDNTIGTTRSQNICRMPIAGEFPLQRQATATRARLPRCTDKTIAWRYYIGMLRVHRSFVECRWVSPPNFGRTRPALVYLVVLTRRLRDAVDWSGRGKWGQSFCERLHLYGRSFSGYLIKLIY